MTAHMMMTLIVFYFVAHKKDVKGILIALVIHTAIDFFVVMISGLSTDYLGNVMSENMAYALMYAILTVIAIVSIVIILMIRKVWKAAESDVSDGAIGDNGEV